MKMYHGKPKGSWKNNYRKFFYKIIIDHYLKDCNKVLDVGAGTGLFYDMAKYIGKAIYGIDLDERNVRDSIHLKNFKDIDEEYDCFFSSQFIEHLNRDELRQYMEKAEKYCRKKIITIAPRPSPSFWNTPDHVRPHTKKSVERLHENYGFKTILSLNLYPTNSFIVIGETDKFTLKWRKELKEKIKRSKENDENMPQVRNDLQNDSL